MKSFEHDQYPGKPKILFVGIGDSTHTHSWIDLLEGAQINVRLFPATNTLPPDDWKVKSYVTQYDSQGGDPAARLRLFDKGKAGRLVGRTLARVSRRPWNTTGLVSAWLAEIVKSWRPDVIHTLGLEPASYFYLNVRRQYGLSGIGKWVAQVRGGPDLALHRLLPEYAGRIRAVLEACDQLIADNDQNYELALGMGLRPEQLSPLGVVPGTGGIDVAALASSWSGPPSKRDIVLWPIAYECPQKKALPVLEALKLAWHSITPCTVHILSTIPETRMWFATLPEEVRNGCVIEERIPRARVLELMTRARVMLAPSLSDGIPNSMYEAMAGGAFPIVSPLDSIRTLVENERNVLFARNLYPDEIAAALSRAMSDDALVDAAADRNLDLVRRIAERSTIKSRVVEYYETLARQIS